MIGCNNCSGSNVEENLSRGNKYLIIDTHFDNREYINISKTEDGVEAKSNVIVEEVEKLINEVLNYNR